MSWWDAAVEGSQKFLEDLDKATTEITATVSASVQSAFEDRRRRSSSAAYVRREEERDDFGIGEDSDHMPVLSFEPAQSGVADGSKVCTEFRTQCFTGDEADESQWLQSLVDDSGSDNGKHKKQPADILSSIWGHASSEGMLFRMVNPKDRRSGRLLAKMAHRIDLIYPSAATLSRMRLPISFSFDSQQLADECIADQKKVHSTDGHTISCKLTSEQCAIGGSSAVASDSVKQTHLDSTVEMAQLKRDIQYAVSHAVCAYPPMSLVTLKAISLLQLTKNLGIKSVSTGSRPLISAMFEIPKSDFLINNMSLISQVSVHRPNFYLCLDRKNERVVLGVRGSATFHDIVTDLNAEPKLQQFGDIFGTVHGGMLESAYYVYSEVMKPVAIGSVVAATGTGLMAAGKSSASKSISSEEALADASTAEKMESEFDTSISSEPLLVSVLKQFPSFRLVITGHSLGGGVSALLALLFKDTAVISERMHAYCFASPCVVSLNIASQLTDKVTTVNLANDCVSRLSIESVKQMYRRMDLLKSCPSRLLTAALRDLLTDGFEREDIAEEMDDSSSRIMPLPTQSTANTSSGVHSGEHCSDPSLRCAMHAFLRQLKLTSAPEPESKLYPLGRILWLVPAVCLTEDTYIRRSVLMEMNSTEEFKRHCQMKKERETQTEKKRVTSEQSLVSCETADLRKSEDCSGAVDSVERMDDSLLIASDSSEQTEDDSDVSDLDEDKDYGVSERKQAADGSDATIAAMAKSIFDSSLSMLTADGSSDAKSVATSGGTVDSGYVVCDASEHRHVFQELVFEFYEGIYSHLPQRYLHSCGVQLKFPS